MPKTNKYFLGGRLLVAALSWVLILPAYAELRIEVISQVEGRSVDLQGAVIWAMPVEEGQKTSHNNDANGVEMEQKERQFNPYILPVQVGVPVTFPNRDDTAHHVYSFSQSHTFQIPLYKKQLPKPITFKEPGIVPLGCNIHDWMIAYIVVVDTPYFDQLRGVQSSFVGLPPGTYNIHLWHPALDVKESTSQLVTYTGVDATLYFTLRHPLKLAAQPEAPPERLDEWEEY